jgi:hypothetical protein
LAAKKQMLLKSHPLNITGGLPEIEEQLEKEVGLLARILLSQLCR